MSRFAPVFFLALYLALPSLASAQGMLIPTDEGIAPLSLRSHRVEFEVEGHAATTHVTQVFHNSTSSQLEATYYFAVPEGATTTDFALWMNNERISGSVLPRDQARQVYENIVRRMRDPGLLEWVSGDLFQASIFPIPPNGDQTVEIEYASVLGMQGTMLRYVYPLHESAGASIPQFVVSGTAHSDERIATVYSPHHNIDVSQTDVHHAVIGVEQNNASAAHDFEVFFGLTGEDVGFSLLAHDPDGVGGDAGYFMMTLSPTAELSEMQVLPKQVTLVIDTSGSMEGTKIQQARQTLDVFVDALRPEDSFNVVRFSTDISTAFPEPVIATPDNRARAHEFTNTILARGNTNISGALERAFQEPVAVDRPHVIIFLTDGLPTQGETDVARILASAEAGVSDGNRRIFAFGVGYDVNTRLLDGLARRGGGQVGYVRPEEQIQDAVAQLLERIASPLMTGIEIDFGAVETSDIYPRPIPDLYAEGQITLFGRFTGAASSSVVVRGRAGREALALEFGADFGQLDGGADTSFVANLWAHRKVGALLAKIDEEGERSDVVSEVVTLATRWNIVTPYTSYLTLDPSEQLALRDEISSNRSRGGGGPALPTTGTQGGWAQGGGDAPDLDFEAPMDPSPAPMDEGRSGGGGMGTRQHSGGEVGGRPGQAPPTVTAQPSAPAPSRAEPRAETGREAVEESIERTRNEQEIVLDDQTGPGTRWVAGRTLTQRGGAWIQEGIGDRTPDETVSAFSDRYFELLAQHPELGELFAIGGTIRFELDGRVIEITP